MLCVCRSFPKFLMTLQTKHPSRRNLRGQLSMKSDLRDLEQNCHGIPALLRRKANLISVASLRCAILGLCLQALSRISPGLARARAACCREICLRTRCSSIQLHTPQARSSQTFFGTFRCGGSFSRSFCQSLHGLGHWLWA